MQTDSREIILGGFVVLVVVFYRFISRVAIWFIMLAVFCCMVMLVLDNLRFDQIYQLVW